MFSKRDDQPPADDGNSNPFKELFDGLRAAVDDSTKAIAREAAETVWLMLQEYQRVGFTRAESFELIRATITTPPSHQPHHD